jgi:large subunit ribosomal protein L9
MKVILTVDVKKVGTRGQLITVADGYAMNVLIPQKKAVPATAENLKKHEKGVAEAKGKAEQSVAKAHELLKQIDGKVVPISAKAGPTGTLFKSVHVSDIVAEIKKQLAVELPESALTLEQPIKQKGTYSVPVELLGAKATVVVEI